MKNLFEQRIYNNENTARKMMVDVIEFRLSNGRMHEHISQYLYLPNEEYVTSVTRVIYTLALSLTFTMLFSLAAPAGIARTMTQVFIMIVPFVKASKEFKRIRRFKMDAHDYQVFNGVVQRNGIERTKELYNKYKGKKF